MNRLFEIRTKILEIYYKYDAFIIPAVKLIMAFIVFHTINTRMGYFDTINNVAIELIASLLCSFLPSGIILIIAAAFSLLHMYHLSIIVAALGLVIYLILYILFLRFAPKASLVVAITPVLMLWKIPYILPIILGLIAGPGTTVAMGCGVIAYGFLKIINSNSATMATMELTDAADQLKLIIDELLASKGLLMVVAAFVITMLVVYFLRRLPINHNWDIAIGAGVVVQIVTLLIGDVIMDTGISFINIILVSILAVVIGFVIKFFRYCVDFNRTENVQFEDDDYYYYVKAVPKISLGESSGRVRRINRRKEGAVSLRAGRRDGYEDIPEEYYSDEFNGYDENGYYEDNGYTEDGTYYGEDGLGDDLTEVSLDNK
ncbi:MAG: hypothetical protein IJ796_00945 [Lachnospiraceae bacterium]|nr:hypothetical protein [Lachnospiraceae bacterium]